MNEDRFHCLTPAACQIREATAGDAPAIEALYLELVADTNVRVLPEQVASLAASPASFLLVAERDGQVVASALLNVCPDVMYQNQPFGVVENVIVHPSERGGGVGRLLMDHVERLALEKHCTKLMLLSSATRKEAHEFFRRCGFNGDAKRGLVKYRRQFAGQGRTDES